MKVLINTPELFQRFLNEIDRDVFSYDVETTGLDLQSDTLVGISFCDARGIGYYLPFGHSGNSQNLDFETVRDRIRGLFLNAKVIIGHNLVFDMQVIKKYGIYPEDVFWFDTMVAQHLIDENNPIGLKALAKRYFDYTMITYEEVSKGKSFADVPVEEAVEYAADDALQTYKLYSLLKDTLSRKRLVPLFKDIEMPFLKVIVEMESNGILIDEDRLITLKADVNSKIEHLLQQMVSLLPSKYRQPNLVGGFNPTINFNSSQQLATLIHGDFGIPIRDRTESGNPSMQTAALKNMNHPFIKLLIEYKGYQKLLTGFIEAMPQHIKDDGKIHCHFNDTGTRTGRLSSSNPNLQQLPKNDEISVRSCFIAGKGKKFIVLDYSQEELRIAAFLSGDRDMIRAYNEGLDLHMLTANKIFNLGLTDEQIRNGEGKAKYDKQRTNAKCIVFGILYGMSKYSLSTRLNISLDEAEKMIELYFKEFPKVKQAIDKAHESVREKGYVRNYYGRYRHFKREFGKYPPMVFRQAYNFVIQGTCADLLRVSMSNILTYLRTTGDEARLIFTVHDEVCIEVPSLKVDFYMRQFKKIMEETLIINPRLIADGKAGDSYADAK